METMSDLAEDTRRKVAEHGYASLSSVTFGGFNELADRLGSVIESADISTTGGYRSLLFSPARMPFHTDGPEAAIVGWWCQRSAYPHGVSLLIDTKAITRELTAEHLIELTRTPIRHPIAPGRFDIAPCLTRTRDGYRIYYSPWHLTEPYPADSAQRSTHCSRSCTDASPL